MSEWKWDRRNLIEQASKTRDIVDLRVPFLRITSVGAYYVKRLINMFAYVDAMVVDTPITNSDWRTRVTQVYGIKERLSRADVFIEYLDSCWQKGNVDTNIYDWSITSSQIRRDIQYINGKASTKEHETNPPPLIEEKWDGNEATSNASLHKVHHFHMKDHFSDRIRRYDDTIWIGDGNWQGDD